jgi:hypothetical protein
MEVVQIRLNLQGDLTASVIRLIAKHVLRYPTFVGLAGGASIRRLFTRVGGECLKFEWLTRKGGIRLKDEVWGARTARSATTSIIFESIFALCADDGDVQLEKVEKKRKLRKKSPVYRKHLNSGNVSHKYRIESSVIHQSRCPLGTVETRRANPSTLLSFSPRNCID